MRPIGLGRSYEPATAGAMAANRRSRISAADGERLQRWPCGADRCRSSSPGPNSPGGCWRSSSRPEHGCSSSGPFSHARCSSRSSSRGPFEQTPFEQFSSARPSSSAFSSYTHSHSRTRSPPCEPQTRSSLTPNPSLVFQEVRRSAGPSGKMKSRLPCAGMSPHAGRSRLKSGKGPAVLVVTEPLGPARRQRARKHRHSDQPRSASRASRLYSCSCRTRSTVASGSGIAPTG